ncbi:hypothetical protein K450DRAFT_218968 [Umbelopsis ramanniana AG]|uniref:Protein kinase domain-containing protein n=1 Tax=Umbelopsis ramanniana AG TaxID=1314678 RepID=A0AAD5HH81_UMBRA|nr:uncharacterized protein K450DRAFT_218968 [Umbelopsis ramanniana AG]KAI8584265.1 hypothetical protein K450DRAFT_218968 [Umbelopsis ramanniana AG]
MFKSPTQSPPGTPSSSSSSVLTSSGSGSRYSRPPSVVIETLHATTSENSAGQKKINQYTLQKEIGHGAFGTVHIAVDTSGNVYAIKEFSKSRLRKKEQSDMLRRSGPRGRGRGRVGLGVGRAASAAAAEPKNPLDLVRGEMAILKKLNHENVVKLFEVLDDPNDDSLYMVFEMAEKGALMDIDLDKASVPYSEEESRIYFRQMILGIEYLHHNEIAHRDIKPDNLLRSKDDVLKIVDFGVSEMFNKGDDRLKKSAGSPAFMAPELCVARHGDVSGTAADIWSMGVTLYCLIYGRLPFPKSNVIELFEAIKNDPVPYESDTNPKLLDLFQKMLTKDPSQRITMEQMRVHPWVTLDGTDPLISVDENCQLVVTEVTEEEFSNAIKSVANIFTVMKAVTKFKRHSRSMSQQSLKAMAEQEPRKDPKTDVEAKHHRRSTTDDETHLAVEGLERDTRRLSIEQS